MSEASEGYTAQTIPTTIAALDGARFVKLRPSSKRTFSEHGHLDARPWPIALAQDANYGLVLDGWGILVDFDHEDHAGWRERLAATPPLLRQRSMKGEHWVWRTPLGWRGRNRKFPEGAIRTGDVKSLGYFVGPGSTVKGWTYQLDELNPDAPTAPEWLMEYVTGFRESDAPDGGEGVDRIVDGAGRHDFLVRMGGSLRRAGLTPAAIERALIPINETLVEPPKTRAEVCTIAKSLSRYPTGGAEELGPLRPGGWVTAAEIVYAGDPVRWWLRGFVPRDELVMIYGKGGVGKSSFESWLAALITQRGGRVLFVGVEEPFRRFAWRASLNGADRNLLLSPEKASTITFPKDAQKLRESIELAGVDVVMFDSIYSHFGAMEGLNAAERARTVLGPLSEICKDLSVAIIGIFHENKAGALLGSVEMENVARYVLKASREAGKALRIDVHKTNLWNPGFAATFDGIEVEARDPDTGELQLEEVEEGKLEPLKLLVVERGVNIRSEGVTIDEIIDNEESTSTEDRVAGLIAENPEITNPEIAETLEISERTAGKYASLYRPKS